VRIVNPTVAVVVPCHNEAAHIGPLLDALAGQTRVPDHIIIVNDASTDATVEVVRAWAGARPDVPVRVVEGPGRGPGPAMNVGIRATDADIIMRMDGHAIPARDYLALSVAALRATASAECGVRSADSDRHAVVRSADSDRHAVVRSAECEVRTEGTHSALRTQHDVCVSGPYDECISEPHFERSSGVVGGVWHVAPGADTGVARAIAAVVSHPLGSGGAAYRHADATGPERLSVETVPFGTFPKALWEQLGGFDESLAANQDFDFNYRARKAGCDVVLDRRVQATYFARPTLAALWRQYSRYGFWKTQMLRKDPRAFHLRQLPPVLVAPWLILSALTAFIWPGALTMAAVALYPLALLAGALHVGVTRRVNPFAAAMAIATVHVAWSVGFWKGVVRSA